MQVRCCDGTKVISFIIRCIVVCTFCATIPIYNNIYEVQFFVRIPWTCISCINFEKIS